METAVIEKPVIVERMIDVPKEITKTISVPTYIKEEIPTIHETEVIVERPIIKEEIRIHEIERQVPVIQEVIREEKAIVENYAYKEVVNEVDRIIEVPVRSHTENVVHEPVYVEKPVILYQN